MIISNQLKTYLLIRRKKIILILIDSLIYFSGIFFINIESNYNILLAQILMRYFPIWILLNYLSNRYHTFEFKNVVKNFICESSKLLINNLLFFSIIFLSNIFFFEEGSVIFF